MIKTKRSITKFYLSIGIGVFFCFGLGLLLLHIAKGEADGIALLFFIIGILFFFLALYTVSQYYKNVPIILADHHSISFGKHQYLFSDVKDVQLTGKVPFSFIINHYMEGSSITFKDGTKKLVFDEMYSNTWELKTFLDKSLVKKQSLADITAVESAPKLGQFDDLEVFKGNQFTSFDGIVLWVLIIFLSIIFLFNLIEQSIISFTVLILLSSIWFIYNSWTMNYFYLTKKHFVVKNHNFLWRKKVYHLSEVKEIVFETRDKMPHCLRVITNNYQNKLYPAATLRSKHWKKLKKHLKAKKIKVRDEVFG